jgi:hypothetical protein
MPQSAPAYQRRTDPSIAGAVYTQRKVKKLAEMSLALHETDGTKLAVFMHEIKLRT